MEAVVNDNGPVLPSKGKKRKLIKETNENL